MWIDFIGVDVLYCQPDNSKHTTGVRPGSTLNEIGNVIIPTEWRTRAKPCRPGDGSWKSDALINISMSVYRTHFRSVLAYTTTVVLALVPVRHSVTSATVWHLTSHRRYCMDSISAIMDGQTSNLEDHYRLWLVRVIPKKSIERDPKNDNDDYKTTATSTETAPSAVDARLVVLAI